MHFVTDENGEVQYTIAKYADENYWRSYWGDKSPVTYGVYRSESAYNTYTGASMGIPEYGGLEEMQKHLENMVEANPCVGYALCPVIDVQVCGSF